jgi:hypothetical protein
VQSAGKDEGQEPGEYSGGAIAVADHSVLETELRNPKDLGERALLSSAGHFSEVRMADYCHRILGP